MKRSILIAAMFAVGAQPASATAASCATRGRTFAADDVARVFAAPDRQHGNRRYVYGCVFGGRRPIRLARLGSSGASTAAFIFEPSDVRVAGDFVAYRVHWSAGDRDKESDGYVVRNLRTRKVSLALGSYALTKPGDGLEVDSFVLTRSGATAWIAVSNAQPGQEVHALDSRGSRVLDHSETASIGLNSLALSPDGTIYWTNRGVSHSATLQ